MYRKAVLFTSIYAYVTYAHVSYIKKGGVAGDISTSRARAKKRLQKGGEGCFLWSFVMLL